MENQDEDKITLGATNIRSEEMLKEKAPEKICKSENTSKRVNKKAQNSKINNERLSGPCTRLRTRKKQECEALNTKEGCKPNHSNEPLPSRDLKDKLDETASEKPLSKATKRRTKKAEEKKAEADSIYSSKSGSNAEDSLSKTSRCFGTESQRKIMPRDEEGKNIFKAQTKANKDCGRQAKFLKVAKTNTEDCTEETIQTNSKKGKVEGKQSGQAKKSLSRCKSLQDEAKPQKSEEIAKNKCKNGKDGKKGLTTKRSKNGKNKLDSCEKIDWNSVLEFEVYDAISSTQFRPTLCQRVFRNSVDRSNDTIYKRIILRELTDINMKAFKKILLIEQSLNPTKDYWSRRKQFIKNTKKSNARAKSGTSERHVETNEATEDGSENSSMDALLAKRRIKETKKRIVDSIFYGQSEDYSYLEKYGKQLANRIKESIKAKTKLVTS